MMEDDKDRVRDMMNRDRENRPRRGDKPSRFSDGSRERERDRSNDRDGMSSGIGERGRKSSNNRVYVSNISYEYRWQDLKDVFRKHVGDVTFVELFVDENDKPKGCGIVEFSDPSAVKKCMEVMHRFELKGRKLVIKEDFGNERDKHGNILNGRRRDRDHKDWDDRRDNRRMNSWNDNNNPPSLMGNMYNRGGGNMPDNVESKWGPTWGLSPQFLESLGINRPLVNRVFVANLDYKVDEKKLREVFKLAGKIIDIELSRDKEGNSRGFAVIEYDHPVESVQAISMFNNQMLYDRVMTVRMDRIESSDGPIRLPEGLKSIGMGLGINGEPLKDVSRHLPSTNANVSDIHGGNPGAGILGAVPNASLPALGNAAAALSNVVNTPTLAGLASASAALQGLTGVQNQLLANNLNELGLSNLTNSSLISGSLNPNVAGLNALTAGNLGNASNLGGSGNMGTGGGSNMGSNMSGIGGGNMGQGYNRGDGGNYGGSIHGNMTREYTSGGNREFETSSGRSNYKSENDYQEDFNRPTGTYSTVNNGSQRRDPNMHLGPRPDGKFVSDTVIVSNLPPTISWKNLREKFSPCGEIQFVDMKNKETAVIRFNTDWEAERAIQLLDRTRVDGRTIEVRFF